MNPFARPFHPHWYLFYLHIIVNIFRSENKQLSQTNNVCINGYVHVTRTCSLDSERYEEEEEEEEEDYFQSVSETMFDIRQAPIGVEIRGIDFKKPISEELIKQFREDVHKYKLLIFKDQGVISGQRHLEISKWFGDLMSPFNAHPKSPHPDIFRVSNDAAEGAGNVGRSGWHIDGTFLPEPYILALYHMPSVPKTGNTDFVSLEDVVGSLSETTRQRWDRLWMVSRRWGHVTHPLVYRHPVTKQPTLCFHLGTIDSFMWDYGTDQQREANRTETKEIFSEIHKEITKDDRKLVYSHKWEVGDFLISDNLAIGHEAAPETQYPVSEVGLRVLHRTTIRGLHKPQK